MDTSRRSRRADDEHRWFYSVARLVDGRRKTDLAGVVEAMLRDDFDHRVLAFDEAAAVHYADISVRRERSGRPLSMADAQIATTCRSHGAVLATRNVTTSPTVASPSTIRGRGAESTGRPSRARSTVCQDGQRPPVSAARSLVAFGPSSAPFWGMEKITRRNRGVRHQTTTPGPVNGPF